MSEFTEELIIKYLENDFSPEEEVLLLNWLKVSEENRVVFLTFKKIYNLRKIKQYSDPVHLDNALLKFNHRTQFIQKKQKRELILRYTRYAAIFILIIATPVVFWLISRERPAELTTINVGMSDSIRTVLLPDGSKVWVNNGSTFKYPVAFSKNERKVILEGEAYFDVKTDSLHPFLVQAGKINVCVHGTSFNVNTNTPDSTIETTLVKGKVSVQNFQGEVLASLLPGYMAKYHEKKRLIRINRVNPDLYISWRNGFIMFDKVTMAEISKKIEEVYKVKVTVNAMGESQNRFNFVFRRTQSLDTVMEMLKFVAPIQYKKYDDQLYIKLK